jgi:hypothetical protein
MPIVDTVVLLSSIQDYSKTLVVSPIGPPPFTPRRYDQQFKIVFDSLTAPTAKRLYIYSFEAGIWSYLVLT